MTPFHAYLKSKGPMTRLNPELLRIAKVTGHTPSHLFRVALADDRVPSEACALAVARAIGRRDPSVTVESLLGARG